jgi:hypothetical protein
MMIGLRPMVCVVLCSALLDTIRYDTIRYVCLDGTVVFSYNYYHTKENSTSLWSATTTIAFDIIIICYYFPHQNQVEKKYCITVPVTSELFKIHSTQEIRTIVESIAMPKLK